MRPDKQRAEALPTARLHKRATSNIRKYMSLHRARRTSADVYQRLIHSIDGIIWEADATTFEFSFVSQQAERILGYPAERWTSEPTFWKDHIHPDDRVWAVDYCLACVHDMAAHEFEYRMIAADGQAVWLRDIVTVVSQGNKPSKLHGVMVDITKRKQDEEHLRLSNLAIESATEGMIITDCSQPDNPIIFANPTFYTMTGYTPAEVLGLNCRFLQGDDTDKQMVAKIAQCIAQKKVFEGDILNYRKDGTPFWNFLRIAPMLDINGNCTHFAGFQTDITERKQAEERLRRLHERFELIGDAINDAVWEWNLETNVVWSNLTHQELFGLTLSDPVPDDQEWKRRLHPDEREQIYESLQVARASNENSWNTEYQFRTENKGWINIYARTYIERNAEGKAVRMIGSMMDISKRKQMEEALANERNLLRTLIDNLPDAIYVKDVNGHFLLKNLADARKMGAATPEETIGKSDFDYYPLPLAARYYADDQAVIQSGQAIINQEEPVVDAHGHAGWVSTTKLPLRDQYGRVIGLVGIGHDITAQKQADEEKARLEAQLYQAQKMESVGRLAGGVAHDFNNMLGVILGHTELALYQMDPALPQRADLEEIQKAAQHSANLTRQLLAFARRQVIAPKVLNLNDTLASTLTMLQRMIGENIHLVCVPAAKLWSIKIDPTQIEQILTNLCVNARDSISNVGTITIETANCVFDAADSVQQPESTPGRYVMLSVSDNGSGMDGLTQAHIFEPFFTTKPLGYGTGLGLATVYGIVKQNNGFIRVSSEIGLGTTFQIFLPQYVATETPALESRSASLTPGGGETILLVEDEPSILKLSSTMLTRLGYQVLSAGTPSAAIEIAEAHTGPIHLLMTDVIMPEMNGRDLASYLLTHHPQLKRLFMSGYTAEIIARHGVLEEGMFFIQKPFSLKDLAAKVREVVEYENPLGTPYG